LIPTFDGNLVLPPHLGNPTERAQLSPYRCTTLELCQIFGTSAARKLILTGFLDFRQQLAANGFRHGFQWLGGSFLEDKETRHNAPPADLDVVTLYRNVTMAAVQAFATANHGLWDLDAVKNQFRLDHYYVDIAYNPELTVEQARYWVGLFSHTRDNIWKGMLRIELNTADDDDAARQHLLTIP